MSFCKMNNLFANIVISLTIFDLDAIGENPAGNAFQARPGREVHFLCPRTAQPQNFLARAFASKKDSPHGAVF